MLVERKLCEGMGYEYCILFSMARVAVAFLARFHSNGPLFIPSNVCASLANAIGNPVFLPVSAANGLAQATSHPSHVSVQLYGYRQEKVSGLEIDTLMSGWRRNSEAQAAVISFGYSKTIDIGYGGAILTSNKKLAEEMKKLSDWSRDDKTEQLDYELDRLDEMRKRRRERLELWDMYLPEWCIKPDLEPVMPWRVIRRIKSAATGGHPAFRDYIAEEMRKAGFHVGTNYPPLPGCTDPSSISWGREVVNFWLDDDPVKAREVLVRCGGL